MICGVTDTVDMSPTISGEQILTGMSFKREERTWRMKFRWPSVKPRLTLLLVGAFGVGTVSDHFLHAHL